MDPRDTQLPTEVSQNSGLRMEDIVNTGTRRPRLGPVMPMLGKDSIVETPERETPHEEIRDSWVSFDSIKDGRASLVPSVFSKRGSTFSASTRYSMRQDSIESPVSVISPISQGQRQDSICNYNIFSCTFCDESFSVKEDWRRHEVQQHGKREHFPCSRCSAVFSGQSLLVAHHREEHNVTSGRDVSEPIGYSVYQSAWGCGFCAAYLSSQEDYLNHVGDHYEGGEDGSQWEHSFVIKALLHQPVIEAAWAALVTKEEQERGATLRFYWDSSNTGPSSTNGNSSLQRVLEFFATGKPKAHEVVEMAFIMAQKRTDVDIKQIRPKVFTQDSEENFVQALPIRPKSQQASRVPEGRSSTPFKATEESAAPLILPLSSTTSAFSSLAAAKAVPGSGVSSARILARVGGSVPRSSSVPAGSSRAAYQPDITSQQFRKKHGPGSLRRTDSDRNLGGLSHVEPSKSQKSNEKRVHLLVSLDKALDKHVSDNGAESSPISSNGDGLLVTKGQSPLASVRTHNSSSTLSDHTRDASTWIEDSTSERISDESLSEPDSSVGWEGDSAELRAWKAQFNQTVGNGMNALWIRYNLNFDALIRECVAGERNSHSPQSRDSSGRVQKAVSSRHGTNRGLRPPSRSFGDDEEDEDDEGDGYRPPASLLRGSLKPPKKFACPFRKRDPVKYNIHDHEVCTVRSWSAISRLKEHLYRRHYKTHCQRCKQIFADARELAEHEMMIQGCEVVDRSVPSDITNYQEKQLKSRKHNARRKTDEEKWREIYELLFPNERVPSPYPEATDDLKAPSAEGQSSLEFQHFLLETMPQLFNQAAEEYYGRQEALRVEAIPQLLRCSLHKAFQVWESSGHDAGVPSREASIALASFSVEQQAVTTPPQSHQSGIYQTPPTSATMPGEQSFGSYRNFNHMGTSDVAFPSETQTHLEDPFTNGNFMSPVTSVAYQNINCFPQQYPRSEWGNELTVVNNNSNVVFTAEDIAMMNPYATYHQN